VPQRLSLRGGVSNAFKTPNIQEQFPNNPFFVSNSDLKPESSHSWELGTDLRAKPLGARSSLTYFHQRFTNLIRPVGFDSTHAINRNIGATVVSGIEAEVAVRPRRTTLGASAAWTNTKIVDNSGLSPADYPNGGTLPFRPVYTASTFAELPARSWLSLFVRASAVGRQTVLAYRFSGPRVSLDPYQVLDVTATVRALRFADTYVRVANVLNNRYEVAYQRDGMPRTITVGLRTGS
jgi:outer membrane receptor protein involved in Fe transport